LALPSPKTKRFVWGNHLSPRGAALLDKRTALLQICGAGGHRDRNARDPETRGAEQQTATAEVLGVIAIASDLSSFFEAMLEKAMRLAKRVRQPWTFGDASAPLHV
jgi:hypothetical protein